MTLLFPLWQLLAAAAATLAAVAAYRNRHPRLSRSVSRRERRAAQPEAGQVEPHQWKTMTRYLIVHDGLSARWIRARGRALRLLQAFTAAEDRARDRAHTFETLRTAHDALASECEKEEPPTLAPPTSNRLFGLLYLGDVAVVSGAIMAAEGDTTFILAVITSIAIAAALMMVGKVFGHHLRRFSPWTATPTGAVLLSVAGIAAVLSLGLLTLRQDWTASWLILSLAPAIGAAGVTVLGPTNTQREATRLERSTKRAERRLHHSERKAASIAGRQNRLADLADSLMLRAVAREQAELATSDVGEPTGLGNFSEKLVDIGLDTPRVSLPARHSVVDLTEMRTLGRSNGSATSAKVRAFTPREES